MVPETARTGEQVRVKGYSGNSELRELAKVEIVLGEKVLHEKVALASMRELDGKGLLALNLRRKDAWDILSLFKEKEESVNTVVTRAQARECDKQERIEKETVEFEQPIILGIGNQEMTQVEESGRSSEEGVVSYVLEAAEGETSSVVGDVDASEEEINKVVTDLPCMKKGKDRLLLMEEVKQDESLRVCKQLADSEEQGYCWKDGLLIHRQIDLVLGELDRLGLPKPRRTQGLKLAHDKAGHFGYRTILQVLKRLFVWPRMSHDARSYCLSCDMCQRVNQSGQRKVPMRERPILSEPFECIALDLVGPLPKAKGGVTHVLTAICLATRWPEAIALKSITDKAIAEAMLEVFRRMWLPSQILTDNGGQFKSTFMADVTKYLGIDAVKTTPYHPQANGVVERMHGTLKPILRKAVAQGLDWSRQLPLALAALRQLPNKSTGYSPNQLVYGFNIRTRLDVLYSGWRDKTKASMAVRMDGGLS